MKGVERLTRRRNDGEEGKGEAGNLIEENLQLFPSDQSSFRSRREDVK